MKKYLNTETILLLVGMLLMLVGSFFISWSIALLFLGDLLMVLAILIDGRSGK